MSTTKILKQTIVEQICLLTLIETKYYTYSHYRVISSLFLIDKTTIETFKSLDEANKEYNLEKETKTYNIEDY